MRYRRRRRRVNFEFKQLVIDVSDKQSIPDLTELLNENNGWYVATEITCPPIVILILEREAEEEEEFTEGEIDQ